MENQNQKEDDVSAYIKRKVMPIFEKVLREREFNRMSVGETHVTNPIRILYQPHNYRLYFDFDKTNFTHPDRPRPTPPNKKSSKCQNTRFDAKETLYAQRPTPPILEGGKLLFKGFEYKTTNHGKQHLFRNFNFCNVIVRKNQIEVQPKAYDKQWVLVEGRDLSDFENRFNAIISDLDNQAIQTLNLFIKVYGGASNGLIIKRWSENGIHFDDYLDKIPKEMIIHDTTFKKVYKDKVEFYNPADVKTYIHNRTIEKLTPEIVGELEKVNGLFEQLLKTHAQSNEIQLNQAKLIENLAVNINAHIPAIVKLGDNADLLGNNVKSFMQEVVNMREVVQELKPKGLFTQIKNIFR